MMNTDVYGFYRTLQPEKYFPNAAWKLDNSTVIQEHEILLDVEIINVDVMCFVQMVEESACNTEEITKIVMDMVEERGKFHNSITGTSGTICGTVAQIGSKFSNKLKLSVGDRVVSLASLTGTPLALSEIIEIDTQYAQITVKGKAIIFEGNPLYKLEDDEEYKIKISALEFAGEMTRTQMLVNIADNILILGASSRMGLLCALSARAVVGNRGKIIGVYSEHASIPKELEVLFDELIIEELSASTLSDFIIEKDNTFDITINCSNRPLIEPICTILTKPGGVIFFAGWKNTSDMAGISAEALGKDINMIFYSGYVEGELDCFDELFNSNPILFKKSVMAGLSNDLQYPWQQVWMARRNTLDSSVVGKNNTDSYVFASRESKQLLNELMSIANFDCNVLISGESGTGKEIAASIIHNNSMRKNYRLVKINCAAIPENLLESELFGYEKGAFTGADSKGKKGLWELANNGTLFLDEIGDLSLALQAKLLRAIDENEIYRVGGVVPIKTNVRVLCATHRNLKHMTKDRTFRSDLYYRLSVVNIIMRPLRERLDDIEPLVDLFAKKYNRKYNMKKAVSVEAKEYMKTLPWHGNIRELDNFIQRLFVASTETYIPIQEVNRLYDFDDDIMDIPQNSESIKPISSLKRNELEEKSLLIAYKKKYGTTRKIAEVMGISQSSVVRRLHKYNIT